jgi:hypothetical protein
MDLFTETIRKGWWQVLNDLLKYELLKSGVHYLVEDDRLYVSFTPVFTLFVNYIRLTNQRADLLVPSVYIRKALIIEDGFLYQQRKRMSDTVNVNTLVFVWNNQLRPPGKLIFLDQSKILQKTEKKLGTHGTRGTNL